MERWASSSGRSASSLRQWRAGGFGPSALFLALLLVLFELGLPGAGSATGPGSVGGSAPPSNELGAGPLHSQPLPIRFRHLSQEDGLFQGTVTCLLQDRAGFLWIGTQEGLHRWDGYDFELFRHLPKDPSSLSSSSILSLAEDPTTGDIWIGTLGGGLSRWRRSSGRFERFSTLPDAPGGTAGDRVHDLLFDGQGHLWVGLSSAGLDRLDLATEEITHFGEDPSSVYGQIDPRVRALASDRAGNLWVGTLGGLFRIAPQGSELKAFKADESDPRSLRDNRVRAVLEDSRGWLWVGTENGLARAAPDGAAFESIPIVRGGDKGRGANQIRSLFEDSAGRMWVGSDGGLHLYRHDLPGFWTYRHDPADPTSLPHDRVIALMEDRGGVLWVGTGGGGASRWQPSQWSFHHFRRSREPGVGLSSDGVLALTSDREDRVWVGTLGGGLDVLDRRTGAVRNYSHDPDQPSSLPDDRVMALALGQGGRLWVGTMTGGLARLDPGAESFVRYQHDDSDPSSLAANGIMSLLEDSRGRLWVGTFGAGLDRLDPGSEGLLHYPPKANSPSALSHGQVSALAEGSEGSLWIGTWGGGLDVLDPASGELRHIRHDPNAGNSLPSNAVLSLHIDPGGQLWVGTQGGGVGRLEEWNRATSTASFRNYSERAGLPSSTAWGLASDSEGRLWISTTRGLACLDPETEEVLVYTDDHGLQSNEFNFGAYHRSPDGELFFGGINGFNAFYPETLQRNDTVPPVVFTAFTKLNRPVDLGRPLEQVDHVDLDHRDYVFSFEFAALDFTAPEANRYAYKLEGLDEDWIDYGHLRRVTFTNLDPGDYVLEVRGSNNDGVWNRQGATISISVAPPPWRSPWAYLIYTLLIAGVVGAFVRGQRAKERQRENLRRAKEAAEAASLAKSQFLANMSHEIRTPMNGVVGTTSLLLEMPASDRQRRFLESLRVSSEALVTIINDILDFSKMESERLVLARQTFDLRVVLEDALDLMAPAASHKGVELGYWMGSDTPRLLVGDGARVRQVLLNLISNGIKFTDRGEVIVTVTPLAKDDEGQLGQPPDKRRFGRGGRSRAGDLTRAEEPGSELDRAAGETGPRVGIRVRVRDSGIGIPDDKQQELFQPFTQADPTNTRRYGGTGLGLAICKRLAELMDGRLWVERRPEGGSTFHFVARFELPELNSVDDPLHGAQDPIHRGWPELEGRRVLLLEGNGSIRRLMSRQLSVWGLETLAAGSVAEALEHLQDEHDQPILALLDRDLLELDGSGWARELGRLCRTAEAPVILLNALGKGGGAELRESLGAAAQVSKPIKPRSLLDRILRAWNLEPPPELEPAAAPSASGASNPGAANPGAGPTGTAAAAAAAAATSWRATSGMAEAVPLSIPAQPLSSSVGRSRKGRPTVLVVDDHETNREILLRLLEHLGFPADSANNGLEALRAFERSSYDVIFMDLQMPVMDGLEATDRLRQSSSTASRPVIVAVTAHAMAGDRERCISQGMDDYLSKPVQLELLRATLERATALLGSHSTL